MSPSDDQQDVKPKSDSIEDLVAAMLLSVAALFYGAYGLYRDDVLLPTRVGTQHLHGLDALVFYIVVVVAVPTNAIRLWAWMRDGDGSSDDYRTAKSISKAAVFGYIAYCVFSLFSGGA